MGSSPKKRFGQNFLIDKNIVAKIVRAAHVAPNDFVVEIGPGRGILTTALLGAGAEVFAIELDRDLIGSLKDGFSSNENFELTEADALKFDFSGLSQARGRRIKLVSNLPYNISGPLVFKLIEERRAFSLMVLMFQKEVARRLVAGPGTKDYGILSVLVNVYADARLEFDVSRTVFRPVPNVDSSVISIAPLPSPRYPVEDEPFLLSTIKHAFSQRRKTALNSLKTTGLSSGQIVSALSHAGLDPTKRAETFTPGQFCVLAKELKAAMRS